KHSWTHTIRYDTPYPFYPLISRPHSQELWVYHAVHHKRLTLHRRSGDFRSRTPSGGGRLPSWPEPPLKRVHPFLEGVKVGVVTARSEVDSVGLQAPPN